ncbi:MAG TPA: crossover junction endodeoxyribonuclease RuvC [Gammaproteobacteria bacterium]|nr:crossover junction endodeoxyribonuclease RuvC [Gammaproteobacteria bacterium]
MHTIIGIDPGSRITGYGVIQSDGQKHIYIASGTVKTLNEAIGERLAQIFHGVSKIVQQYQPMHAAIEQVFMAKNANSALKLGQARGAAIVAMATQGLSVAEYSARAIKQAVVGYGAAQKEQVQHMVKLLLNLPQAPGSDAADALAIAICHAQTQQTNLTMRRLRSYVAESV